MTTPDVAVTRAAVLDDLEHGVTSVWLHIGDDGLAVGDLREALADVRLDLAPGRRVVAHPPGRGRAGPCSATSGDRSSVGGALGLDPLGSAARLGTAPDLAPLADLVRAAADRPGWRAVTVDATVLHDAGATDVDALAAAVATGVAYVRHLEAAGITPAQAFDQIEFRVGASADQFLTAAALRALRRVWARVGEASGRPRGRPRCAHPRGHEPCGCSPVRTRGSTSCAAPSPTFGASIGGADAITVLPFDTVLGLPERLGRRLARNTQILLADEANVARVTDPGGGSWYLESLTDDVARAVWARFQQIEASGGAVQALADGLFASWVADAVAQRDPRPRHPVASPHGGVDVPAGRGGHPRPAPPGAPAHRGRWVRPATRRDGIRGTS
jgi:methylmalonyl-CoA mutase